jgi:hypothetical protein
MQSRYDLTDVQRCPSCVNVCEDSVPLGGSVMGAEVGPGALMPEPLSTAVRKQYVVPGRRPRTTASGCGPTGIRFDHEPRVPSL